MLVEFIDETIIKRFRADSSASHAMTLCTWPVAHRAAYVITQPIDVKNLRTAPINTSMRDRHEDTCQSATVSPFNPPRRLIDYHSSFKQDVHA